MDPLYQSFGALVRDTRIKCGLTQEALGKRMGLSRTAITNIEKGNQSVSLVQLYEFATQLGVDPKNLLPNVRLEVLSRTSTQVQELVAEQSDQQLLIKMMKGHKSASRS